MILALVLCSAFVAVPPADLSEAPSSDLKTYHEARGRAGHDAQAHVRLALWCDAHGLNAERVKHLAIAVLIDPNNPKARGLMGMVADFGRWRTPEAVADRVHGEAVRVEYCDRRTRTPNTPDAQWRLALWCEQKGLLGEARAHLTAVTRLDPGREAAWARLGFRRHAGRWMTDAEIMAEKAEAAAQRAANRRWKTRLEQWKRWLDDKRRRSAAEQFLVGATDPRAVPSVVAVFGAAAPSHQLVAVQLLGQMNAATSSRALAALAVSSPSPEVRRRAIETLVRRDPRDFVAPLIALLHDPIRYQVRPVRGPGLPGSLLIEGERFNEGRIYSPPPLPDVAITPGSAWEMDAEGVPVLWVTTGAYGGVLGDLATVSTLMELGNKYRERVPQFLATAAGRNSGLQLLALSNPRLDSPPLTRTTGSGATQVQIPIGRIFTEIREAALCAQQQLLDDVRFLERHNADLRRADEPILRLLWAVVASEHQRTRTDWAKWWSEERGFLYASTPASVKPTVVEEVPLAYQPQPVGQYYFDPVIGYFPLPGSCFGAGTPVCTMIGPRDRVGGCRRPSSDPGHGNRRVELPAGAFNSP